MDKLADAVPERRSEFNTMRLEFHAFGTKFESLDTRISEGEELIDFHGQDRL